MLRSGKQIILLHNSVEIRPAHDLFGDGADFVPDAPGLNGFDDGGGDFAALHEDQGRCLVGSGKGDRQVNAGGEGQADGNDEEPSLFNDEVDVT